MSLDIAVATAGESDKVESWTRKLDYLLEIAKGNDDEALTRTIKWRAQTLQSQYWSSAGLTNVDRVPHKIYERRVKNELSTKSIDTETVRQRVTTELRENQATIGTALPEDHADRPASDHIPEIAQQDSGVAITPVKLSESVIEAHENIFLFVPSLIGMSHIGIKRAGTFSLILSKSQSTYESS